MDTLAKSDIFFFVTTFAVVFVSLGILAVTVYLLYLLKELKAIISLVKREGELISEDLADLRGKVATEGFKLSFLWGFVRKLWQFKSIAKKKNKTTKE